MSKIITFLKNNYWSLLKVLGGLFLLYWIVFVLTPKTGMSPEQKQMLDSLNNQIKILQEHNLKLENHIDSFNYEIKKVDENINKIKGQKTIIKEIYHEKISGVDKLTVRELDSFFAKRYNW